jgi:hypothetical protein
LASVFAAGISFIFQTAKLFAKNVKKEFDKHITID